MQAAERLAREDVQLDRDQRAGVGIEQRVRRGDSREAVGQVAAGAANRGHLHVLAVRVDHLAVARDHLALDLLEGQQRLLGQRVHALDERAQIAPHDEVGAVLLERLDRRRRTAAEP